MMAQGMNQVRVSRVQKTFIRFMALSMCQNNFDEKELRPKRAVPVKTADIADCIESSASSNKTNGVQGRGRCLVCKVKKTKFVCSICKNAFVCREMKSNTCMRKHRAISHS